LRNLLHFIDHNQAISMRRKKKFRLGQSSPVRLALHIQQKRTWALHRHGLRERGFANLTRTQCSQG